MKQLWLGIALVMLAGPVAPEETHWTSKRGLFLLTVASELQPLEINTMHSWVLQLSDVAGQPVTGAVIEVTGGMPLHDHGLPTRPRVTAELGEGAYQLAGMRFHMRGEWQLLISVVAQGKTDAFVVTFSL